MVRKISMAALLVVLALTLLQSTYATNYTVGDSTGWRIPNSNGDYDNWADNKNFVVGDILVFNFATGAHDVAKVTEAAYEACTTANPISIESNGPATITLNETGDHYFICTIGTHCSSGQKLKVEVGNGTSPTPGSSPNTPGVSSPPPPPPSSASSLVATLSLVFMSIALVLLC